MKIFLIIILLGSSILAYDGYIYGNNSGYKSDSKNTYEYDLSKPLDRLGYQTDTGAQQRDDYDRRYNNYDNHIEKDRSKGQYGGGIYGK